VHVYMIYVLICIDVNDELYSKLRPKNPAWIVYSHPLRQHVRIPALTQATWQKWRHCSTCHRHRQIVKPLEVRLHIVLSHTHLYILESSIFKYLWSCSYNFHIPDAPCTEYLPT
jgi:hypothetical protein